MQYKRNRNAFTQLCKQIKLELRRTGIRTVCRTDRNCQRIDTSFGYETDCLLRIGVHAMIAFRALSKPQANMPEFRLYAHAYGMSNANHLTHARRILLVRKSRAIKHYIGEPQADCMNHLLERLTVIKNHRHGNLCLACHL